MGSSHSESYSVDERKLETTNEEISGSCLIMPSGAKLVPEWSQIACVSGHHALRKGSRVVTTGISGKVITKQNLLFCQKCLIIVECKDVCGKPCMDSNCASSQISVGSTDRFLCFLPKGHDLSDKHTCCNCPHKDGTTGTLRLSLAQQMLDMTDGIQSMQENMDACQYRVDQKHASICALRDETKELLRLRNITPEQRMNAKKKCEAVMNRRRNVDGLNTMVAPVHVASHINPNTVYEVSLKAGRRYDQESKNIRTEHRTCEKSSVFRSSSYSSTSRQETTTQSHDKDRKHVKVIATRDPISNRLHMKNEAARDLLAMRISDSARAIEAPSSGSGSLCAVTTSSCSVLQDAFIYTEWGRRSVCPRGQHNGCLVEDAVSKHQFLYNRKVSKCSGGETKEETVRQVASKCDIVCCTTCGIATCFAYDSALLHEGNISRAMSVPGGVDSSFGQFYIQSVPLMLSDSTAPSDLNTFASQIYTPGPPAYFLYSHEQVEQNFPYHDCNRHRHVFGLAFDGMRCEIHESSRLHHILREHTSSYSSSSNYCVVTISRSGHSHSRQVSSHRSAVVIRGSLHTGHLRCMFCTKETEDHSRAFGTLELQNDTGLSVTTLVGNPAAEAEGAGFSLDNPSIRNWARESSVKAALCEEASNTDNEQAQQQANVLCNLPLLPDWLNSLPLRGNYGEYMCALDEAGISLADMVVMKFRKRQLDERVRRIIRRADDIALLEESLCQLCRG